MTETQPPNAIVEPHTTNQTYGAASPRLTSYAHLALEPFSFMVIDTDQAAKFWGVEAPASARMHRYSRDFFATCSAQNHRGLADWRLVPIFGLSLFDQDDLMRRKHGDKRHTFNRQYPWWLNDRERALASERFTPGVYLMDFMGQFPNTDQATQELLIPKYGASFIRAPAQMFAEAQILTEGVTGDRLAGEFFHRSSSLDSNGHTVCVGTNNGLGIKLMSIPPTHPGVSNHRVCLYRKFDY